MKTAVADITSSFLAIAAQPLSRERVRVFPKRFELFCLIVPAILVCLLILDKSTLQVLSSGSQSQQLNRFVTSLLFFNSIHVYFTFAYLLTVPEIKSWIREITDGRPWKFWLVSTATFPSRFRRWPLYQSSQRIHITISTDGYFDSGTKVTATTCCHCSMVSSRLQQIQGL